MNSGIVVLVVILISFLRWLFQQIAAGAEKRRQQQLVERQRLEQLRTGRIENTANPEELPAAMSKRDSEARRREELAELRRRAAARRQPRADSPVPPAQSQRSGIAPALEILLGLPPGSTTGGTVSPSSTGARDRAKSRPLKPQRPQRTGSQPDPEVEARRRAQQRRSADRENAAAEVRRQQESLERQQLQERARALADRAALASQTAEQRLLRDAKPIAAGIGQRQPVTRGDFVPKTAADWRRALAMNEVLGKPVSLR